MNIYSNEERRIQDAMHAVRGGASLVDGVELGALLIDRHGFLARIDDVVYEVTLSKYEPHKVKQTE